MTDAIRPRTKLFRRNIMEKLEKVEKLRERANVTYEEASAALEEAGGDLLDALVILEKQGKTASPNQSTYSTSYEEQKEYVRVEDQLIEAEHTRKKEGHAFKGVRETIRSFFRVLRDNSLIVTRQEKEFIRLPLWLLAIVLLVTGAWKPAIVVIIISLFFQFRYSVGGKDQLTEANSFMEKASEAAEHIKEEFQNKKEEENHTEV